MKQLKAVLFTAVFCLSIFFIDNPAVQANTNFGSPAEQVVPKTKRVSRRVYRKGRWVTITTWRHGKRISKRVWRSGNRIGRKTAHKTRDIIMGPKKPTP